MNKTRVSSGQKSSHHGTRRWAHSPIHVLWETGSHWEKKTQLSLRMWCTVVQPHSREWLQNQQYLGCTNWTPSVYFFVREWHKFEWIGKWGCIWDKLTKGHWLWLNFTVRHTKRITKLFFKKVRENNISTIKRLFFKQIENYSRNFVESKIFCLFK